ncbi:MAG TPA: substrate-binding domain-containing protein [Rariglobus sp.]|nr:substrate-binding domain-containing protein [Rariglobus sp.]
MPNLPQRQSLASQTADILREGISQGIWQGKLPSERALCERYQISRNTLRAALRQLQRDKIVQAVHGSGNRILAKRRNRSERLQSRDVALLSPEPLEHLLPMQTLWVSELRAMLNERGCRLHVFHGRQYFRTNPGPVLQRLLAHNSYGCWILMLSNAAIQRWFSKHEVRCVVAGSVHAGLDLPYRDLDHRATCRHAAGVLLSLGHRKLALVVAKPQLAGDMESEAGFSEGIQKSPRTGAEAVICRHDGSVTGIGRGLRRLMAQTPAPTAILVANAYHYLTVVSHLSQIGRRVPQDVSVISRDDDLFLSYLTPAPARYLASAHTLAKSLLGPVLETLANTSALRRELRLMPKFTRGESIASITPIE